MMATPTVASATTVSLGQSQYTPIGLCSPGTNFAPSDPPGAVVYTVPSAGAITSWSYLGGPTADQVKLKILRSTGVSGQYVAIGESALETTTRNVLNTFTVSIPVEAGDIIGIYLGTWSLCAVYPTGTHHSLEFSFDDPAIGVPFDPMTEVYVDDPIDLNVSATLDEAVSLPTSTDECKAGGWRSFGNVFKTKVTASPSSRRAVRTRLPVLSSLQSS